MSTLVVSLPADRPTLSQFLARPEIQGIAFGLTAAAIWGAYLAMARAGVSAGLQSTDIAAIRFGVAGLVMLPWLLRHGVMGMAGMGLVKAGALALLAGPLFVLVGVGGYTFAPLAHGAVVQPAALTLGSVGLAMLVLGERPDRSRVIGVAVILAGLAVTAGPGLMSGGVLTPLGDLMFAAAGMLWAVFTVLNRRWNIAPLAATAAVSVLSAAVYVPIYLLAIGPDRLLAAPPATLAAQIVVQGLLSGVIAVIAFANANRLLGPGRAAIFPALVPAVAIALGVPITGELPTWLQLAGLVCVSLGLLVSLNIVRMHRAVTSQA